MLADDQLEIACTEFAIIDHAVPRKGYVLTTAAEEYGRPIREAVGILERSISPVAATAQWLRLYACRRPELLHGPSPSSVELSAWCLVTTWIVGVVTDSLPTSATLVDAEAWFLGKKRPKGLATLVAPNARAKAEEALRSIAVDAKVLSDLLPYILDPHGEGSRLSVKRRPETATARKKKKSDGVFYTPADVAAFMVAETLRGIGDDLIPVTALDPACGTGVFLRAMLIGLKKRTPNADLLDLACSGIYGIDIDARVLNSAAFVILHDCFVDIKRRGIPPISAWHALRLNLAQFDALRLDPVQAVVADDDPRRLDRLHCRARLKTGEIPRVETCKAMRSKATPLSFQEVFPELAAGPRIIIGNPPYADIGAGVDLCVLAKRFSTLLVAPRASSNVYPLFVEQMVRLTAPNAHGGAMVVPLSVAANTGGQFTALRKLIGKTPGDWKFAFFDREPHALFGEDVKTRNAILVWTAKRDGEKVQIFTGPLQKWRSHNRARMFEGISFTSIPSNIDAGIPKVVGKEQAAALKKLQAERFDLGHVVNAFGPATLATTFGADSQTVYVGATAYNFLNVFLAPPQWDSVGATLTEHPLHAIQCASRADALRVFALLSSRLAFWWWHANGDGFHVSRGILRHMPVGATFTNSRYSGLLAGYGDALWTRVKEFPVLSRNRARTSLAFSAVPFSKERTAIDVLLIEALGLDQKFSAALQSFTHTVTTAEVGEHAPNKNRRKTHR